MRLLMTILIAITSLYGLSSCGGNINCRDEAVSLAFRNFDSLSLDKILLIKYKKATGFSEVVDSTWSGSSLSYMTYDTVGTKLNNLTYSVFNPDFDYVVYVVKMQKKYAIRDITFHKVRAHTSCKLCENDCLNDCSYYLNDSLIYHKGSVQDKLYVHIYR